jgi:hypothetical protein
VSVWIVAVLLGGAFLFLVGRSLSRSAWWDSMEEAKRKERIRYDRVATDILDSQRHRSEHRGDRPKGPRLAHPTQSHCSSCNGKEALGGVTTAESRQQLPAYCVYLRPFRFTGQLSVEYTEAFNLSRRDWSSPWGAWRPVEQDVDIETLLRNRFEPKLKFIGFGHIAEPSSGCARRVYLDDAKWWPEFVTLAEGATLIVVMPDPSDNCVREASWLRTEQLFGKCIFYMRGSVRRGETWYEPEWNKAVERFREVGIWLPQYNPAGAIFTLHLAGTVKKLVALDFTKAVYKSNRLRDRLMLLGQPVSSYVSSHSVGLYRSEPGPY